MATNAVTHCNVSVPVTADPSVARVAWRITMNVGDTNPPIEGTACRENMRNCALPAPNSSKASAGTVRALLAMAAMAPSHVVR